jgi:peptidoglycan/xylan/chitin deacetylase (PgdA/CDA1 family)
MAKNVVKQLFGAAQIAIVLVAACAISTRASAQNQCTNPVYLTFDVGNMAVAPQVGAILKRNDVKATFFAANTDTTIGDGSLGNYWAPWWKARAADGHEFASNTYDRVVWRADLRGVAPQFRMQPSEGAFAGREFTWDAAKYCAQISHAAERVQDFTGKKTLPLFRAPGGKTSPRLLASAKACGYAHVGWSSTGLLGDALPSERFSNEALLKKSLQEIRAGDILLGTLGSPTRKVAWAPEALEPLILGLKAKGFCFKTLREHPAYQGWIASHGS